MEECMVIQAAFLDECKSCRAQKALYNMKQSTMEEWIAREGDSEESITAFKAIKNSKEGFMRIERVEPTPGKEHFGWTYAFAENISLYIDNPDRWYHTSVVKSIDWEKGTFTTLNSVYKFRFIEEIHVTDPSVS